MEKIAIFPGSFDPFTVGHESIVIRSLELFDKVIIAVGFNTAKSSFFPLDKRIAIIKKVFAYEPRVEIISYQGLTIDLCIKLNVKFLLRGLRTAVDFEFERAIGQSNKAMYPELESVFLLTAPEHAHINSSIVRDILYHKGDPSKFLSEAIDIKDYL